MVKRKIKKKRKTTKKVTAKIMRTISGKKYFLKRFAFTNKTAAKTTALALKKDKRVKGTATIKQGNNYLVYIRVWGQCTHQ